MDKTSADMDKISAEMTAPIVGDGFVIGYVPEIHKLGKEHPFEATTFELELLAEHWAEQVGSIEYMWEYFQQSGSEEIRLQPYAWERLGKIADVLGKDRVNQVLERTIKWCFRTSGCEAPRTGGPSEPEDKVLYTERGRSAVFHPSRAGLRPMVRNAEFVGEGWCWQTAEDYKSGKVVEHFGFATAQEALQAAQKEEYAFFYDVEQELEGLQNEQAMSSDDDPQPESQ